MTKRAPKINNKDAFYKEVINYWDARSETYSNSVKDELYDSHFNAWNNALLSKIPLHEISTSTDTFKVLDLGCGPGFFEIIFSRNGCKVDAVDSSVQMIEQAKANVSQAGNPKLVTFHCGDVMNLPFPSFSFDVVISRNVTWLMTDPIKAYAEWHRVLKPGGKLLVFDANWYSYLVDESLNQTRLNDQTDTSILEWSNESFATAKQETHCETIALNLPLTYEQRPAWDESVLPALGFSEIKTDCNFSDLVWNKGEQAFYATSPLFAIEAQKIA